MIQDNNNLALGVIAKSAILCILAVSLWASLALWALTTTLWSATTRQSFLILARLYNSLKKLADQINKKVQK